MVTVLLTSEKLVKEIACISDNIAGEYIQSGIVEAQEIQLKSIMGPALLEKVKSLIKDKDIDKPENEMYNELVEKCQYYLAYTCLAALTYKTTFKITNFGVAKSSDENLQVPSFDDVAKVRDYYQSKADFFCIEIQTFLIQNRRSFPELTENRCNRIHANLYSAATCGIFLGGAFGKR